MGETRGCGGEGFGAKRGQEFGTACIPRVWHDETPGLVEGAEGGDFFFSCWHDGHSCSSIAWSTAGATSNLHGHVSVCVSGGSGLVLLAQQRDFLP